MLVLVGRTDLPRGAKAGAGPSWLAQGGGRPEGGWGEGSRGGARVPLGLSIGVFENIPAAELIFKKDTAHIGLSCPQH